MFFELRQLIKTPDTNEIKYIYNLELKS